MPIYEIRIRADIATPQLAAAIRDKLLEQAQADTRITVISWDASRASRPFQVTTVDTGTKAVSTQTVDATDPQAAAAQIGTALVVAGVREL